LGHDHSPRNTGQGERGKGQPAPLRCGGPDGARHRSTFFAPSPAVQKPVPCAGALVPWAGSCTLNLLNSPCPCLFSSILPSIHPSPSLSSPSLHPQQQCGHPVSLCSFLPFFLSLCLSLWLSFPLVAFSEDSLSTWSLRATQLCLCLPQISKLASTPKCAPQGHRP